MDSYASDHFGLRETLIGLHTNLSNSLFPKRIGDVLVGKKGWLYYLADGELEDLQHRYAMTLSDVDIANNIIIKRGNDFAVHRILYSFVVAPNKQAIYPEFLPDGVLNPNGFSRLEQVEEAPSTQANKYFLSLRPALLAAKAFQHQLYLRTDTHWNHFGAYQGYVEIMRHLGIEPNQSLKGTFTDVPISRGDLSFMADLPLDDEDVITNQVSEAENVYSKLPVSTALQAKSSVEGWVVPYSVFNAKASDSRTVLVFGDSFSNSLVPFLSSTFRHVTCVPTRSTGEFFNELVPQLEPNIVIEERIERGVDANVGDSQKISFSSGSQPPLKPDDLDSARVVNAEFSIIRDRSGNEEFCSGDSLAKMTIIRASGSGSVTNIRIVPSIPDEVEIQGCGQSVINKSPFDFIAVTLDSNPIAFGAINLERTSKPLSGFSIIVPIRLLNHPGTLRVFGIVKGETWAKSHMEELFFNRDCNSSEALSDYGLSIRTSQRDAGPK